MINDISFVFETNTFIYGKSGTGKTTLLKFLSENFQNYEGLFLINKTINFKNINLKDYKNKILYLGQYDYLFDGTVRENIQQFKNKIDLNLFKDLDFFKLLEKNNIQVSKTIKDNGINLIKGQRQIINFISLFFTEKDIYLIDEPLSNVNKETAYYLFKLFIKYKKKSLIIMCDHDLTYMDFFQKRLEIL
nr:ATP-binding cassette domain-containing protein [Spiroplasma taiwanense]